MNEPYNLKRRISHFRFM